MCIRAFNRTRPYLRYVLAVVFALAMLAGTLPAAPGASSGTVVGATVPSAVALDDSGCRSSSTLDLGSLTTSSWAIGAPCTITFGSSNDSARLKVWQRDETAPAMESLSSTWTPRSGTPIWRAVATGASPGYAWIGGFGAPGEPASRLERTTDGGNTWVPQTACNGHGTINIEAIDDTELFLSTQGGLCHTIDGGSTWSTVAVGSFQWLSMVSSTLGYATGNGNRVYKTIDGTTWSEIHASAAFTRIGAISANASGIVVAHGTTSALPNSSFGAIYSTDGGSTWSSTTFNTSPGLDTTGGFNGAYALDATTLIASGPRSGTMRSTDSGATWNQVSTASFKGEAFRRSDGALFVTGNSGDEIRRSLDNGASWPLVPLGTGISRSTFAVAGSGLNELWAVGDGNRRLRSMDAGSSWTPISAMKPNYLGVLAWTSSRWAAVGVNGTGVRTIDGGTTLASMPTGVASTLNDGLSLPGGVGVAVGVGSTIIRTTDFGVTWTTIAPPVGGIDWTELVADDSNRLWIAGTGGRVASSSDLGLTWTLQTDVPGTPLISALTAWRGQVWVGGPAGAVWRSPSTGTLAWTSVPTGRTASVLSIWAIDATSAVALTGYDLVVDSAHASRTTDGGATWSATLTSPLKHTRDLATDDGHRFGWITGESGFYRRSVDRGLSWAATQNVGVSQYLNRMEMLNGGRGIAAGEGSMLSVAAPTATVPDGMGGAGSGFGACLETASGTAINDWVLAGPGNCTSAVAGNWTSIAADSTGPTARIATTGTGGTGVLGLRFGLRASGSQSAGDYSAVLVFEAVAPSV